VAPSLIQASTIARVSLPSRPLGGIGLEVLVMRW